MDLKVAGKGKGFGAQSVGKSVGKFEVLQKARGVPGKLDLSEDKEEGTFSEGTS